MEQCWRCGRMGPDVAWCERCHAVAVCERGSCNKDEWGAGHASSCHAAYRWVAFIASATDKTTRDGDGDTIAIDTDKNKDDGEGYYETHAEQVAQAFFKGNTVRARAVLAACRRIADGQADASDQTAASRVFWGVAVERGMSWLGRAAVYMGDVTQEPIDTPEPVDAEKRAVWSGEHIASDGEPSAVSGTARLLGFSEAKGLGPLAQQPRLIGPDQVVADPRPRLVPIRERANAKTARAIVLLETPDGNKADAVKLFREASGQGDAEARYRLGCIYEEGKIVKQDCIVAINMYARAAEAGHALAQLSLGSMREHGCGDAVQIDMLSAAAAYQKAADQGVGAAMCALGRLYYLEHVQTDSAAAQTNAYALFAAASQKPVDSGRPDRLGWLAAAQAMLGVLLELGEGVPQDPVRAVALYRDAMKLQMPYQYSPIAAYRLGMMYERGNPAVGIMPNKEAALQLFTSALEREQQLFDPALVGAETQYRLGDVAMTMSMSENARAVETPAVSMIREKSRLQALAIKLYYEAANRGSRKARLAFVRQKMRETESGAMYKEDSPDLLRTVKICRAIISDPTSKPVEAKYAMFVIAVMNTRTPDTAFAVRGEGYRMMTFLAEEDASKGYPEVRAGAMLELARRLDTGDGLMPDRQRATRLIHGAESMGITAATKLVADAKAKYVEYMRQASSRSTAQHQRARALYEMALMHLDGRGCNRDDALGIRMCNDAAELGSKQALAAMGIRYYTGAGVPIDKFRSLKMLMSAVQVTPAPLATAAASSSATAAAIATVVVNDSEPDPSALVMLGDIYKTGDADLSIPADPSRAYREYERAAIFGDASALARVGAMYEAAALDVTKRHVPTPDALTAPGNEREYVDAMARDAVRYYMAAATQGLPEALNRMATFHREGFPQSRSVIAINNAVAFGMLRISAAQNDCNGLIKLAEHYVLGLGVPANIHKWLSLVSRASTLSCPRAKYLLGRAHIFGENGVDINVEKGLKLLRSAANMGYPDAHDTLGVIYQRGRPGIPADVAAALTYHLAAAGLDHANGAYNAGMIMKTHPRHVDKPRAAKLLQRAVDLRSPRAHVELALMLLNGDGIPKDVPRALALARGALALGHPIPPELFAAPAAAR